MGCPISYAKFQRDPPSGSATILEKNIGVASTPPARERVNPALTGIEKRPPSKTLNNSRTAALHAIVFAYLLRNHFDIFCDNFKGDRSEFFLEVYRFL